MTRVSTRAGAAFGVALALALGGCQSAGTSPGGPGGTVSTRTAPSETSSMSASTAANPSSDPTTGTTSRSTTTTTTSVRPLPDSAPQRIVIPAIGVDATVLGTGLNPDGTVEVPTMSQLDDVGWYDGSPAPGTLGPAVLLGHVTGRGRDGAFVALTRLRPGDRIQVRRFDGSVAQFAVTGSETVAKDAFPTERVYGDTSDPELRLVTCGGSYDAEQHSYPDNVIVYARLVV